MATAAVRWEQGSPFVHHHAKQHKDEEERGIHLSQEGLHIAHLG